MKPLKRQVQDYWDRESCGEVYADGESARERYDAQRAARYQLEPYIAEFCDFGRAAGEDLLEVGVGMGADHVEWARAEPHSLTGLDLTPRAIAHNRDRLAIAGLDSRLVVGDAERLPFADESFDLVYSWGVLHHSPDPATAIRELHRVLRPGGTALVMLYHTYSLVGYMLWIRYALLRGRPWTSLRRIYAERLESPGTQAYSRSEAHRLFADYGQVEVSVQLTFGDLLEGGVGQRHRGPLLRIARRLWPRWLLRRLMRGHGLDLLIEARK